MSMARRGEAETDSTWRRQGKRARVAEYRGATGPGPRGFVIASGDGSGRRSRCRGLCREPLHAQSNGPRGSRFHHGLAGRPESAGPVCSCPFRIDHSRRRRSSSRASCRGTQPPAWRCASPGRSAASSGANTTYSARRRPPTRWPRAAARRRARSGVLWGRAAGGRRTARSSLRAHQSRPRVAQGARTVVYPSTLRVAGP